MSQRGMNIYNVIACNMDLYRRREARSKPHGPHTHENIVGIYMVLLISHVHVRTNCGRFLLLIASIDIEVCVAIQIMHIGSWSS